MRASCVVMLFAASIELITLVTLFSSSIQSAEARPRAWLQSGHEQQPAPGAAAGSSFSLSDATNDVVEVDGRPYIVVPIIGASGAADVEARRERRSRAGNLEAFGESASAVNGWAQAIDNLRRPRFG